MNGDWDLLKALGLSLLVSIPAICLGTLIGNAVFK